MSTPLRTLLGSLLPDSTLSAAGSQFLQSSRFLPVATLPTWTVTVMLAAVVITVVLPAPSLAHPGISAAGLKTSPETSPATPDDTLRVVVVADDASSSQRMVERVETEVTDLFAARRPVKVVSQQAESSTQMQTDIRRAANAVVAVGPVAATQVCASDASPAPRFVLATGSSALLPLLNRTPNRTPNRAASESSCQRIGADAPSGLLVTAQGLLQHIADAPPSFDRIDLVVPESVASRVPSAAEHVSSHFPNHDVRLISARPADTTQAFAPVVLLDHIDRWSEEEQEAFTRALTRRGVATISPDLALARSGKALIATRPNRDTSPRQLALAIEEHVSNLPEASRAETNREEADAPISSPTAGRETIVSETVANGLGLQVPWDVTLRAEVVGRNVSSGQATTLARSMRESIRSNLQLQAKRQQTDAAANRVDVARSRFLPQVNASARGRLVNEDLASASLGAQPEELLTSTLNVRQVLFSEPAFAQFSVERRMQAMREFERQSVRLDAAQQAADAYVRVLQAEAATKIQRENVRVVRANLNAARARQRAGDADPRQVSRLETQEARAEQGFLRAIGRLRSAKVQYNRVLNRPLDAPVELDQATGVDPRPVLAQFPYRSLLERRSARPAFRAFWVEEARTRAPEVEAVQRLVGARERQLESANRSFWMPEIALEGSLSDRLYEGGIGTSGLNLNLPGTSLSVPPPPDQQWSVGVTASFPLFNGTERAAQRRQAQDQLAASRTQQMIAELGVEQSIRTALIQLETSQAAVDRALTAADAAQRTLDITQAAYREGTVSLVDLIDAQTSALTTRQEASDAAYGLIRDWMAVQRAAGSFETLRTEREQAEFEERLRRALPRVPGWSPSK